MVTPTITMTSSLEDICSMDSFLRIHLLPLLTCQDIGRLESASRLVRRCLLANQAENWKILRDRDFARIPGSASSTEVFPRAAPVFNIERQKFDVLLEACDSWKQTYQQWKIWATWVPADRGLTSDELSDFREAFERNDTICDGVGTIGLDALHMAMKWLGQNPLEAEIAGILEAFLASEASDTIDLDLYLLLMKTIVRSAERRRSDGVCCSHNTLFMLNAVDGQIDIRIELPRWIMQRGQILSDFELNAIGEEFDADGDGKLTYEEFQSVMES